jgi:Na+/H+-dicarboxylate symporter
MKTEEELKRNRAILYAIFLIGLLLGLFVGYIAGEYSAYANLADILTKIAIIK